MGEGIQKIVLHAGENKRSFVPYAEERENIMRNSISCNNLIILIKHQNRHLANYNLLPYSSFMNTKKVDNPHDLVARKYFSNPGAMGNFLREFLPREMYEALDISSLEPTRESFIAPGLKESIADIVFRYFTKDGKQGSIYIV